MKYTINSTEYNIPSIPMIEGNYRYAKEVTCNCGGDERFYESVNHWTCDGIYDGSIGQLICFTCNRCGCVEDLEFAQEPDFSRLLPVNFGGMIEQTTLDFSGTCEACIIHS